MSLQMDVPRTPIDMRIGISVEMVFVYTGVAISMAFLGSAVLEYVGLMHTEVGWFLVDQYRFGEARFNPNGDHHGDWGNQIVAVLTAPTFAGMFVAACTTYIREFFTGAAE